MHVQDRKKPRPTTTPDTPDPVWTRHDLEADPHRDAEKDDKVRRMFSAIARSYDLNNRVHSLWLDTAWRRCAVRSAGDVRGKAVLDVACGTGDLAEAFARAGADSVTGLDITPAMLDVARERADAKALSDKIRYVVGNAMDLAGIPDNSVDVLSIAFGIRNVSDPARALGAFARVLRPGGRLVILEFSDPTFAPVRWINNIYCKGIMPRTATWISKDTSGAYKYLPKSVETFLSRQEMRDAISAAGFSDVRLRPLTFGIAVCYSAVRNQA